MTLYSEDLDSEMLIVEFQEFCSDNNFAQLCAEDLLLQMLAGTLNCKDWQIQYVKHFITRWDACEF